jgi:hypothetical protein
MSVLFTPFIKKLVYTILRMDECITKNDIENYFHSFQNLKRIWSGKTTEDLEFFSRYFKLAYEPLTTFMGFSDQTSRWFSSLEIGFKLKQDLNIIKLLNGAENIVIKQNRLIEILSTPYANVDADLSRYSHSSVDDGMGFQQHLASQLLIQEALVIWGEIVKYWLDLKRSEAVIRQKIGRSLWQDLLDIFKPRFLQELEKIQSQAIVGDGSNRAALQPPRPGIAIPNLVGYTSAPVNPFSGLPVLIPRRPL